MNRSIICVFVGFLSFFHLGSFAENPIGISVIAKNRLELPTQKDGLIKCNVYADASLKECRPLSSNIPIVNPNVVDSSHNEIYVANYGRLNVNGTSFILRCSLSENDQLNCQSLFGLASAMHVTGLKVAGEKLYFIQSYTHPLPDKTTTNVNYLTVCNLNGGNNGRIGSCGPMTRLIQAGSSAQGSFNTYMSVSVASNGVYVTDPSGRSVFHCSLPDTDNRVNCGTLDSPYDKNTNNMLIGEFGLNTVKTSLMVHNNLRCLSESNFLLSADNISTVSCALEDESMQVFTKTNASFLNPFSLDFINGNYDQSYLYVLNKIPVGLMGEQTTITSCQISSKGEFGDCSYITPTFDTGVEPISLENISSFSFINIERKT